MKSSIRQSIVAVVCGVLSASALGMSEPDEIPAPKRVRISGEVPPMPIEGGFVGDVGDNGAGSVHVYIRADTNLPGRFPRAKDDRYAVFFPPIHRGDLIRAMDGVYRIKSLGHFEMIRVENRDLPAAVRPTAGTYAFSIGGSNGQSSGGTLHRERLLLLQKLVKKNKGRQEITILISGEKDPKKGRQTVGVGDLLWIGKWAHRVRKIVPADAKLKITGWIEIDQKVEKTDDE